MRTTIATSSQCARSAARFRVAETSTARSSVAKTTQVSQFATSANVSQPADFVSASTMRMRISASVAASTTGSNGVCTRPDSSWCHMEARFGT